MNGGLMGKFSRMKRLENYYKIYEQIYENPVITIYDIAENTGLSRNTVSKYLHHMYTNRIIVGPYLSMDPAPNYKEYIYLMNFQDPFTAYNELEGFPHVLYHAMTFGDWNTIVITDKLLDLSQLVGVQTMVYQDVNGHLSTPKVNYTTWDEGFAAAYELIHHFNPDMEYKERKLAPALPWGKNEWKLYHAFKFDMRQKITPVLRKINVRYEHYTKWMKTLETFAAIHTTFYPAGYDTYNCHCLLISTNHEDTVKSVFSLFPTTPVITEVGSQLLVFLTLISSQTTRNLICLLYTMQARELITHFNHSVILFDYTCKQ